MEARAAVPIVLGYEGAGVALARRLPMGDRRRDRQERIDVGVLALRRAAPRIRELAAVER